MNELSILLLGDTDRTEFRAARAVAGAYGAVSEFADVDSAAAALAEGAVVPDVIVVAQAFPGQFSHQPIDRLRRLAPLARVVGLMGSWCEGEMRTGSPWPAAVRTYWHQWTARCDRQLQPLGRGAVVLMGVAAYGHRGRTPAGRHVPERWPRRRGRGGDPHRGRTRWRIGSRPRAAAVGFASVWQRSPATVRVEGAAAAIFDAADLCDEECDDVAPPGRRDCIPRRSSPCWHFPRAHDQRGALSAGAAAVLSKPLAVDDSVLGVGSGEQRRSDEA